MDSIDIIFKSYNEVRLKLHADLLVLQELKEQQEASQKDLQKQLKTAKSDKLEKQLDAVSEKLQSTERSLQHVRDELGVLCNVSAALLSAKNKKYPRVAATFEADRLITSNALEQICTSEAGKTILRAMMRRIFNLGVMSAGELFSEKEGREKQAELELARMKQKAKGQ